MYIQELYHEIFELNFFHESISNKEISNFCNEHPSTIFLYIKKRYLREPITIILFKMKKDAQ